MRNVSPPCIEDRDAARSLRRQFAIRDQHCRLFVDRDSEVIG
jgi:hypothetical protein